jgi:hypothetical protein
VEQFWHFGESAESVEAGAVRTPAGWLITQPGEAAEFERGGQHGWRSCVFGHRSPAPVLVVRAASASPVRLAAVLHLSASKDRLCVEPGQGGAVHLTYGGVKVEFAEAGLPRWTSVL